MSVEPSLGSMKPYPFAGWNHFTVPVVMSRLVLSKYRVRYLDDDAPERYEAVLEPEREQVREAVPELLTGAA